MLGGKRGNTQLPHDTRDSVVKRVNHWSKRAETPAKQIITDNGPQFISRDFKKLIRIAGMTHVKTSPYYPQSNGKIERYHRTIKGDCIRVKSLESIDDARDEVTRYVEHYNTARLHSAIGYVTPHTKLAETESEVFSERDRKLESAREQRRLRRQQQAA